MDYAWSVCIRSFSGAYFPAFGLNTKRYSVSLRTQFECGKIRTRKNPNTDIFHPVQFIFISDITRFGEEYPFILYELVYCADIHWLLESSTTLSPLAS